MRTTFINCRTEDRKQFRQEARQHLASRSADITTYMEHGTDADQGTKTAQVLEAKGLPSFYEYGLSADYVAPGTFTGQRQGYFRFQISWGGPSEEVRFYISQGVRGYVAHKIEFVFMNWGTGIGLDVTNEDWAKWLFEQFEETGTVQAEVTKATEE